MSKRAILGLLLISITGHAQQQDARLFLYNAGFGGITAGIGAVINRPKGTDWKETFVRAFWQGSVGGALRYSAKKTLYLINDQKALAYGLPAMLLQAAGNSVSESAALNRPFLRYWNLAYGPVRFDIALGPKPDFRARFLPSLLYGIPAAGRYGNLDPVLSLLTGCISFKTGDRLAPIPGRGEPAGRNYGRAIIYTTYYGADAYRTVAHELGHCFQYTEYQILNTWLIPFAKDRKLAGMRGLFSTYVYFDAPYLVAPYMISGLHPRPSYYRNFFELEAERFATNRDVQR